MREVRRVFRTRALITLVAALLATILVAGVGTAREEALADRLLHESPGLRRDVRLAGAGPAVDGSRPEEERPRVRQAAWRLPPRVRERRRRLPLRHQQIREVRIYFLGLNEEGLSGSRPSTSRRSITQQRQHQ